MTARPRRRGETGHAFRGGDPRGPAQYLAAGLVDQIVVSLVPILLGGGARLFDNLGEPTPSLRQVECVEAPGVTHSRYAREDR